MRSKVPVLVAAALVTVLASSAQAVPRRDTAVTDQTYVRHDGGTDSVIEVCNSDDPEVGGSNLAQNEPAVAIKPDEPSFVVAAANDYCATSLDVNPIGLYVSGDGGESWTDSLVPGYAGDTSDEGQESPLFGRANAASDPLLDWDNDGRLFVGGISFDYYDGNGDVFVARYDRDASSPLGIDYRGTTIVGKGTPAPYPAGRFNDKPSMKVDDWGASPHEGNVYVAWTLFPGVCACNTAILFARSTDGGAIFSAPIKLSQKLANAQGSEVAVGPDGTVYVFWRQYSGPAQLTNAILFVRSTDGGVTFSKPRKVADVVGYDRSDLSGGALAFDCGDGDLLCESNFVFHRSDSLPQATVDSQGRVYVTWEQVTPVPDNGDSYRPDGQSRIVVTSSATAGARWSVPIAPDPQPVGHQWWPNIEYDKTIDRLALIYYDSREDPSYSPNRPPGNLADGTSVCGTSPIRPLCNILNTFVATSTDGISWTPREVSTQGHQPEYEMFADRQVPFQGDYIWVDAEAGLVYGVWTDNRDVVPGEDPREALQDGFDVLQCREGSDASDTCSNAGGLNQNIYGASLQ